MQNLRLLRKNSSLTQRQFAEELNIAKTTLCYYEQGKISPPVDTIIKIADYFGCSIDYLLGHETQGIMHMDSFPPTQQKIIPLLQQLNESQANYVYGWCTSALGIPYDDAKPKRPW